MGKNFIHPSIDPLCPTGALVDYTLPSKLYERAYSEDRVHFENIRLVKYVLDNVQRIFSGVRHYNQGGWCFTARPIEWHIRKDVVTPFPVHLVFAVYCNPHRYIYDWRSEKIDVEDSLAPIEWRKRYEALVWKRTS